METHTTQQEILLITGTSFLARECCDKNDPENPKQLSEIELLEEACWNGLLPEMLPEICEQPHSSNKLYMWQVKEAASFLEIDLGETPAEKDHFFSIDPYTFLKTQLLS